MAYLLDANVFIQAKNLHYGFDFCPAFWDWVLRKNKSEELCSIEKIRNELEAGNDELAKWAGNQDDEFFRPPDQSLVSALAPVSTWVTGQSYEPAAVNTFFQVADYYLVAYAYAHQHTIVTHEVASPSSKKIKIPNVCIGLKINHMTPYEMLRKDHARFVLG